MTSNSSIRAGAGCGALTSAHHTTSTSAHRAKSPRPSGRQTQDRRAGKGCTPRRLQRQPRVARAQGNTKCRLQLDGTHSRPAAAMYQICSWKRKHSITQRNPFPPRGGQTRAWAAQHADFPVLPLPPPASLSLSLWLSHQDQGRVRRRPAVPGASPQAGPATRAAQQAARPVKERKGEVRAAEQESAPTECAGEGESRAPGRPRCRRAGSRALVTGCRRARDFGSSAKKVRTVCVCSPNADDLLRARLAQSPLPHENAAVVILHGSCYNFGAAPRACHVHTHPRHTKAYTPAFQTQSHGCVTVV